MSYDHPDMGTRTIPLDIRRVLQSGFVTTAASQVHATAVSRGDRSPLHPGDSFGRVLAYLWDDQPDEAMIFLADYLAELNGNADAVETYGEVTLAELLASLRLCMPDAFDGLNALQHQAVDDVPEYYGRSI